ncbi:MAG: hypothetical protein ACI9Y1_002807 [Lentisphaeria bacterium]|jgi:hypothetical protein
MKTLRLSLLTSVLYLGLISCGGSGGCTPAASNTPTPMRAPTPTVAPMPTVTPTPTPDPSEAEFVLLPAEDYQDFFDNDDGNTGGQYRTDNVNIEVTADVDGGFNVGWTSVGEWLEYDAELGAGLYRLDARVASEASSGAFELVIDGESVGELSVGATGGWQTFQTLSGK